MVEFFPVGDDGLRVELFLPQSPSRVFRAWSSRDEFQKWFRGSEDGHLIVHSFDFREGGGFEVTMVAGNGYEATLIATYLTLDLDRRLRFTWSWKSPEGQSPEMIVDIEFRKAEAGTLLVISHQPFQSLEDRDNHQSGWLPCLTNLAGHLAEG